MQSCVFIVFHTVQNLLLYVHYIQHVERSSYPDSREKQKSLALCVFNSLHKVFLPPFWDLWRSSISLTSCQDTAVFALTCAFSAAAFGWLFASSYTNTTYVYSSAIKVTPDLDKLAAQGETWDVCNSLLLVESTAVIDCPAGTAGLSQAIGEDYGVPADSFTIAIRPPLSWDVVSLTTVPQATLTLEKVLGTASLVSEKLNEADFCNGANFTLVQNPITVNDDPKSHYDYRFCGDGLTWQGCVALQIETMAGADTSLFVNPLFPITIIDMLASSGDTSADVSGLHGLYTGYQDVDTYGLFDVGGASSSELFVGVWTTSFDANNEMSISTELCFYDWTSAGTFAERTVRSVPAWVNRRTVSLVDLNKDGSLDILFATQSAYSAEDSGIYWMPNNRDGTFGAASLLASFVGDGVNTYKIVTALTTGDANDDGDIDVVATTGEYSNYGSDWGCTVGIAVLTSVSAGASFALEEFSDAAWDMTISPHVARDMSSTSGSASGSGSGSASSTTTSPPTTISSAASPPPETFYDLLYYALSPFNADGTMITYNERTSSRTVIKVLDYDGDGYTDVIIKFGGEDNTATAALGIQWMSHAAASAPSQWVFTTFGHFNEVANAEAFAFWYPHTLITFFDVVDIDLDGAYDVVMTLISWASDATQLAASRSYGMNEVQDFNNIITYSNGGTSGTRHWMMTDCGGSSCGAVVHISSDTGKIYIDGSNVYPQSLFEFTNINGVLTGVIADFQRSMYDMRSRLVVGNVSGGSGLSAVTKDILGSLKAERWAALTAWTATIVDSADYVRNACQAALASGIPILDTSPPYRMNGGKAARDANDGAKRRSSLVVRRKSLEGTEDKEPQTPVASTPMALMQPRDARGGAFNFEGVDTNI